MYVCVTECGIQTMDRLEEQVTEYEWPDLYANIFTFH